MTHQAFVDESKVGGLTFVVAVVPAQEIARARQQIKAAKPQGAVRLHFSNDRRTVKDNALKVIRSLPITFQVFDLRQFGEGAEARGEGLRQMVPSLERIGVRRLVLEDDKTMRQNDKRALYLATRPFDQFHYEHCSAKQEPLLWIPDAVAWCLRNKDKRWRSQAEALINPAEARARSAC